MIHNIYRTLCLVLLKQLVNIAREMTIRKPHKGLHVGTPT